MPLLDDLKLDEVKNANDVDQQIGAPPVCPEGDHHAVLVGFRPITEASTPGRELTFRVLAGPGKGKEVKEALWSPAGKSADKDARSRNRMRIFAHRLGLLAKVVGPDGKTATYQPVPGKTDFGDAFGAQCVIRVKHREREYEKDGQKKKVTDAELDFEGVFALDDERVNDVPRASPEQAQAAVAGGTAAFAPADNFDDV